jgi:hypothetical protein
MGREQTLYQTSGETSVYDTPSDKAVPSWTKPTSSPTARPSWPDFCLLSFSVFLVFFSFASQTPAHLFSHLVSSDFTVVLLVHFPQLWFFATCLAASCFFVPSSSSRRQACTLL